MYHVNCTINSRQQISFRIVLFNSFFLQNISLILALVDGSQWRWNKNKLRLHLAPDQSLGYWGQQFCFCRISYLRLWISWEWDVLSDVSFNMCGNGKSRTALSAVSTRNSRKIQNFSAVSRKNFNISCFLIFSYKCHVHGAGCCRKHIEAWALYILPVELRF